MANTKGFRARLGLVAVFALIAAATSACGGEAADQPDDPAGGSGGTASGGSGGKGGSSGSGAGGSVGGEGGGPQAFDPSDLQLNDVSLLFPLPTTNDEQKSGLLAMTAKGERGELLPEKLFDGLPSIFGSKQADESLAGAHPTAPYANLRVVALRVDPCFASLEPPQSGEGCQNQLRLVVQETEVNSAFDSGLHLFYSISREEVLDLVKTIGGLRQKLAPSQALGKLQPHPLMVKQGLAGEMANGVRKAILAHAGSSNLERITRMTQAGDGPFWDFNGFDVESGKLVPMKIPTLPADQNEKQTIVRGFGAFQLTAEPASGSDDDFLVLSRVDEANALGEAERAEKLTSLLRVENPRAHSPDTIDCASCHSATPAQKLVIEPTLGWSLEGLPAFEPNTKLLDAEDLELSYDGDTDTITNVHAFSYFGSGLGISQRVVNESAAVVEYLSKQDFGGAE